MGRFLAILILGLAMFGYAAYHFELFAPTDSYRTRDGLPKKGAPKEVGELLYAVQELPPVDPPVATDRSVNPLLISGTLQVVDKQEISPQVDGQILYVGEEIPLGALALAGVAPFLLEPCNIAKIKYQIAETIKYSDKIQFVDREYSRIYRRPLRGQMVSMDQSLAVLNPIKALGEIRAKFSKVESADAEVRAAVATANEAKNNYERSIKLFRDKALAEYELQIAKLTWIRHLEEAVGKEQAVKSAKVELEQAQLYLTQHEVRNQLGVKHAIIKEIFRERGESVKPQDKIMELQSLDRFMAEGHLDVNHYQRVKVGMAVTIEPTQEESPLRVLKAHRAEITSIAFTKDDDPRIVSASEDRTVLVWDRKQFGPVHFFAHEEPVRSVACSPRGAADNLILAGCADGTIHVWDLSQPDAPARRIAESETAKDAAHRDAVTCLAFSPDGELFASGSADATIKLWNVKSGTLVYSFTHDTGATSPHQGTITSLYFTPQCRLVSAARDNTVRVWELHKEGVKMLGTPTAGRSGTVQQLGVSGDGRYMLFDQGKTLQLLSVDGGRTINTLSNPGNTILFDSVALFSPDSTLLLTAGAPEGRLQLWTRPTANSRGFEVRQLVTDERSTVTCAAFAPAAAPMGPSAFAASGTKDGYVYLWPIPSKEEVQNHRIRDVPLSTVNPTLDVASRQIRIGVEVPNEFSSRYPNGRLLSNRPVTIVID